MSVSVSPLTAVALSGGVDSLVAAVLLKAAGSRLVAVHFLTGYESTAGPQTCLDRTRRLCARLGLDLEVVDCRQTFQKEVVEPFAAAYRRGLTPNPCARCNPLIKFGPVLDHALALGADRLATGHYARRTVDPEGRVHLYRGLDPVKEQSYFLARLTPGQLARAVFPLGELTKAEVIRMATASGVMPEPTPESQDVCFVRQQGYAAFLAAAGHVIPCPGPIVDVHGRTLGRHEGLHRFTVGQRQGINCPGPQPYYVVRLEPEANRLVVGSKSDILSGGCRVLDLNWIQPPPAGWFQAEVRLRYRSPACIAKVRADEQGATVLFKAPQAAVTPGQSAVFYQGAEVLGAGWIAALGGSFSKGE